MLETLNHIIVFRATMGKSIQKDVECAPSGCFRLRIWG